MRVFVLGHNGMLGHVVTRYFADVGLDVLTSDRRYQGGGRDPLVEEVRRSGADWIVNAIGRIKQKCSDSGELFRVNSLLPLQFASRLGPGQRFLHASTDCVFSGRRGAYRTHEVPDAEDDYGVSKILGEAIANWNGCRLFRVSIIGPALAGGHGLLAWFFQQQGPVNGFTNHKWNGITTLEWAKQAVKLIVGPEAKHKLVQLCSPQSVSKYELLHTVAEVWHRKIDILPMTTREPIDRTLVGDVVSPPLWEQLAELRDWYEPRFGAIRYGAFTS